MIRCFEVLLLHPHAGLLFAIAEPYIHKDDALKSIGNMTQIDAYINIAQFGLVESQLYFAHVATRCIFIIDNPLLGPVGFITIGMTEVWGIRTAHAHQMLLPVIL